MTVRVRIEVFGKVQGVGFRWFTRERARRWGLVGWVRNRRDGSVEIVTEGPASSIDGLIEMLRKGPPGASVTSIERSEADDAEALPDPFTVMRHDH